jgi:hypothetical protein
MHRRNRKISRDAEKPRSLTPQEKAVLRALLKHADFDGRGALLGQIDVAQVVGRCGCGCATVDLEVGERPVDEAASRPLPNQANVIGADGEPIGGVMVFIANGRLSTLEVYSNTDEPINPLPSVSELDLYHLPIR